MFSYSGEAHCGVINETNFINKKQVHSFVSN